MLLSLSQWALLALSIVAIGLLLIRGRLPERIAGLALLGSMVLTPLVAAYHWGDLRWGVGLVELALAVVLVWLSYACDRWWVLAAAGVQLASVIVIALSATPLDIQIWASVTVRLAVWLQLMILALFGVVEARRAPYAARTGLRS